MLVVCFLCLPVPNRKHWMCQLKKLLLVKGFLRDICTMNAKLNPSRAYDYLPRDNYLLLCLFSIVTRDWNTSQKGTPYNHNERYSDISWNLDIFVPPPLTVLLNRKATIMSHTQTSGEIILQTSHWTNLETLKGKVVQPNTIGVDIPWNLSSSPSYRSLNSFNPSGAVSVWFSVCIRPYVALRRYVAPCLFCPHAKTSPAAVTAKLCHQPSEQWRV